MEFLFALCGGLLGGIIVWLGLRSRSASQRERLSLITADLAEARRQLASQQTAGAQLVARAAGLEATLAHERSATKEKLAIVDRATEQLREAFSSLAAEALKSNNRSFIELAKANLEKFQSEAKRRFGSAPESRGASGDADSGVAEQSRS